jgi:hypothetical protein
MRYRGRVMVYTLYRGAQRMKGCVRGRYSVTSMRLPPNQALQPTPGIAAAVAKVWGGRG